MPRIESTELIIGMEVHVQLATRTKMFSRTPNIAHQDGRDAEPNTLLDPVVLALPGTLPVMNRAAVEMAVTVGLALNCTIARYSVWDRKNYFYADLPKGYQISQYDRPLCGDGGIDVPLDDGSVKPVGILRAHLEEDAGKLGHELPGGAPYDGSLVDYNRAGTPLLEIVSRPDLRSADEAVAYARTLRSICRFLGVTQGDMQRGHMRFEPNVNVRIHTDDGREFVTPIVEVKNLNSFRALKAAIEFEHRRQVQTWQADAAVHAPGAKSTRGWNDARGETFLQREKEEAHDYRYFRDPDLPPVQVSDAWRDELAARLPELPHRRRVRFVDEYGLSAAEARTLTEEPALCEFFESCVRALRALEGTNVPTAHAGHECAKWLLNAGARLANERGRAVHDLGVTPRQLAQLIDLRDRDVIGSSAADDLFALLCDADEHAEAVAQRAGLLQVRDADQLAEWVAQAIKAQPDAADDYAAGKDAAISRLIGEVMKRSAGRADARAAQHHLQRILRG